MCDLHKAILYIFNDVFFHTYTKFHYFTEQRKFMETIKYECVSLSVQWCDLPTQIYAFMDELKCYVGHENKLCLMLGDRKLDLLKGKNDTDVQDLIDALFQIIFWKRL